MEEALGVMDDVLMVALTLVLFFGLAAMAGWLSRI